MTGTATSGRSDLDRRWLKTFAPRPGGGDVRLVCFHHAGGSAGAFRAWPALLPDQVELVAVQLPGRADRFNEPPFRQMGPLVDELVDVLEPLLDRPFACYGVSMGARVAWALTHALRELGLLQPMALYLACDAAPRTDSGIWAWEGRTDGLEGYVREMGGTPPEVLAEPTLLAALLPVLGADLTVLRDHDFHPAVPLDMPIHAFAGIEDPEAPPERMRGWAAETRSRFALHTVAGGHFLDPTAEGRLIATIGADLIGTEPGRSGTDEPRSGDKTVRRRNS